VVLAASRIEPWKGQSELVSALSAVSALPWRLWIAGEGQRPHERAYGVHLRELVQRLGLADRVRFLGARRDVGSLMGAADVVAQANVRPEPFGIVFAEAMFAGRPVVTARMGGAIELVDESCGRLYAPGHAEDLQRALSEVIADAALRSALGTAGRVRAQRHCAPDVVIPQLEAALSAHPSPDAAADGIALAAGKP
jgi:glycosyltransferase involved in cell wall biosynthesis